MNLNIIQLQEIISEKNFIIANLKTRLESLEKVDKVKKGIKNKFFILSK